jgi:hypothetical protein
MMTKNKMKTLKKIALVIAPIAFFGCYHTVGYCESPTQNQQSSEETKKLLQDLTQYEIDGAFLILQCKDNINNQLIKSKLQPLQTQFEKDIRELSNMVKKYDGVVPDYTKDFKGYFMNGYAAMRGIFTDKGAIKALHTNLGLIQKSFESALTSTLPSDAKESVRKVYEDNQKALEAIKVEM